MASTSRSTTDDIPVIDLSKDDRQGLSEAIVEASENYGVFIVENHGVHLEAISAMEGECWQFFTKPLHEKQMAGPANPLGYGAGRIGSTGDRGKLEYLLLHTYPDYINQISTIVSQSPADFSSVMNTYLDGARELACMILDLMAAGLGGPQFSNMIRHAASDSLLRLNHYPPENRPQVGFGEHSDPQILSVLWSSGVDGLEVRLPNGAWKPLSPPRDTFCIFVGELLQAMTNGRFVSVRHRALTNRYADRLSVVYFAAPPLGKVIKPLPGMVTPASPRRYRNFTWAEYKERMYQSRLAADRLEEFRLQ